jgi:hypothetical protein
VKIGGYFRGVKCSFPYLSRNFEDAIFIRRGKCNDPNY